MLTWLISGGGILAAFFMYRTLRTQKMKVVTVIDGDTYQVITRKGKSLKVRLYGVDCPELTQAHGPESAQFVANLIHKKWVPLTVKGKDRYGRTLAAIKTSKGDLARLLVKAGYAHVLPNARHLRPVELYAKLTMKGMWRQLIVKKPWNHHSRKK